MKKVLVLNGINLNMFGKRDPKQYGTTTLAEIDVMLGKLGQELGAEVESFQTNCEGTMVERIHQAFHDKVDAVVINAGAWTHYSYGLRDALAILTVCRSSKCICRMCMRAKSSGTTRCLGRLRRGQICGFGAESYLLGLRAAISAMSA